MNSPLWTVLGRHRGVRLRSYGHGPAVIVIPGMEGSGESCLDLVLPVIKENVPARTSPRLPVAAPRLPADDLVGTWSEPVSGAAGTLNGLGGVPVEAPGGIGSAFAGTPGRVILVDYAAERHRLLGQLVDTIVGLLGDVVQADESLVWWGQSFGCLLAALVRQQFEQPADRIVLVSPFTGLPAAKIRAGRLALAITPGSLYGSTAGGLGRVLLGPDPDDTGGPFFAALAAMHPLTVRRRLGWLGGQDFASAFLALRDPLAVWLGERDRLVDLPRQLAFFGALTRRPGDQLTVLGACGHVVLPSQAMDTARAGIRSYLTSPATPTSPFQG